MEGDGLRRQHRPPEAHRGRRRQSLPDGALFGQGLGASEDDVTLVSVPMSHNTGFTGATIGLLMGHHLVVMPRFDPVEFLRLITDHRVTFLATVPTVMQRLLPVYRADPDAYDLSSIRRFWHVGAPCPPAIKEAWIDLLGPEVIWELYGGTELQAMTFLNGAEWLTHRGSVGRVVAGRDEGARRRRSSSAHPAWSARSTCGRRRARRPTYRYIGADGEEPRRLGLTRRSGLLRRRRLPLPQRPARRHVHRRRPQRLPRGDRGGTVRTPGYLVLLGGWHARQRSRPGAATRWSKPTEPSTRPP